VIKIEVISANNGSWTTDSRYLQAAELGSLLGQKGLLNLSSQFQFMLQPFPFFRRIMIKADAAGVIHL